MPTHKTCVIYSWMGRGPRMKILICGEGGGGGGGGSIIWE